VIRLILTRLATGVAVILVVATVSFWLLHAAPGGPFDEERQLQAEVRRNIEKRYHLDWPAWKQYAHYMAGLIPFAGTHGWKPDLGHSMKRTQTVEEIIAQSFPVSARLGVFALVFAVAGGILLGVLAAARQNRWLDHGAMGVALLGISVPPFVLGPLLIMSFALGLMWLPPAQYTGFASLILPAATLGMIYMGVVARLARSGMLETLRQDYVRTARAKGLSERVVVWKHALRLGLLPVVTFLGPAAAALISGSFVVEKVFQLPGLGFYFVNSISDRDYPVLCGLLVFYSAFLVLLNLAVDLAYGFLDPRVRSAR